MLPVGVDCAMLMTRLYKICKLSNNLTNKFQKQGSDEKKWKFVEALGGWNLNPTQASRAVFTEEPNRKYLNKIQLKYPVVREDTKVK